jgi:hypothetical protein
MHHVEDGEYLQALAKLNILADKGLRYPNVVEEPLPESFAAVSYFLDGLVHPDLNFRFAGDNWKTLVKFGLLKGVDEEGVAHLSKQIIVESLYPTEGTKDQQGSSHYLLMEANGVCLYLRSAMVTDSGGSLIYRPRFKCVDTTILNQFGGIVEKTLTRNWADYEIGGKVFDSLPRVSGIQIIRSPLSSVYNRD